MRSFNVNNLIKYVTMKVIYSTNMTLQKRAIIDAITEWNQLHSAHYKKEILMNEEILVSHNNNYYRDTNNMESKDVFIFLLDTKNKKEVINKYMADGFNLELLTNNSIIFLKHQIKNISIIDDLKIVIHQKINELEGSLSEMDIFKSFDDLDRSSLLLLTYAVDTNSMYYYPEWVNDKNINLIKSWAAENNFSFHFSSYENIIVNLAKLNLLDIIEFTEYGQPRLYKLPYRILKKYTIYENIKIKKDL